MKNKILSYFFENPFVEINIRSLAKKLGSNQMTIKRKVDELVKEKLLIINKKKLEYLLKLNYEKTLTEKRIYNIKKIINSGIIEFLESVYEYPNSIILFGSYSFGENNEQSDIDIAIQTTLNKKIDLKKYEQKLRHTIQIFLLDEKTPENLKKSIYNGIVLRGRIQ